MSGEMMMFPATVDEFMEQYKIVDTEEIYTNGSELVPIFRMKQWFEHLDAVPVKHGEWEIIDGCVSCSVCGEPCMEFNYCPNCGAKMDGGKDDGT